MSVLEEDSHSQRYSKTESEIKEFEMLRRTCPFENWCKEGIDEPVVPTVVHQMEQDNV
jgi:hypothetical protein